MNDPYVTLLGQTTFDKDKLRGYVEQALGGEYRQIGDYAKLEAICNRTQAQHHYNLTFIVVTTAKPIVELITVARLDVFHKETIREPYILALVTANMFRWRHAIIDGLSKDAVVSQTYRLIMTQVLAQVEQFGNLIEGYKKTVTDGHLRLEHLK